MEVKAQQKRIRELERQLKRSRCRTCGGGGVAEPAKKSRRDLGQGRGRLISRPDRDEAMQLIDEAVQQGARRARLRVSSWGSACAAVQRWRETPQDRPYAGHPWRRRRTGWTEAAA